MLRDSLSLMALIAAIAPVDETGTTPLVSAIVDCSDIDSLTFAIQSGVLADAGATWTTLLEHGDDAALADAAAVPDAQLVSTEALASFTQANDGVVKKLGYIGNKRYVRLTITPAGNAASGPFAVLAITSPRRLPAA